VGEWPNITENILVGRLESNSRHEQLGYAQLGHSQDGLTSVRDCHCHVITSQPQMAGFPLTLELQKWFAKAILGENHQIRTLSCKAGKKDCPSAA